MVLSAGEGDGVDQMLDSWFASPAVKTTAFTAINCQFTLGSPTTFFCVCVMQGDTCVSPFHALGTACYVPTDDEARAAAMAAAVAAASSSSSSHATTDSSGGTKQSTKVKGNYAHQLFEITSRHAGIEQWRHHAVEIATYNMVSW